MVAKERRDILRRLNAYDSGPTEDGRRATREVAIREGHRDRGCTEVGAPPSRISVGHVRSYSRFPITNFGEHPFHALR